MPIKKISEELVWEISQSYPNLKLLNLANNHIRVVENLEPLTALERLNLSGNKLVVLRNISCIGEHLVELHAAKNEITAADLQGLSRLCLLDLADNRVTSMASLDGIAQLPSLTRLMLQGNPLASRHEYQADVLHLATCLTSLDGRPVVYPRWALLQEGSGKDLHDVHCPARLLVQDHFQQHPPQQHEKSDHCAGNGAVPPQHQHVDSPAQTSLHHDFSPATTTQFSSGTGPLGQADEHAAGTRVGVNGDGLSSRDKWYQGHMPAWVDAGSRGCMPEEKAVRERVCQKGKEQETTRLSEQERAQEKGERVEKEKEEAVQELLRERRRSKALEANLAETMELLAAERHLVATFREKEALQHEQLAQLTADACALQSLLEERDQQLRSLRAYLAKAAMQAPTDVQVQTEEEWGRGERSMGLETVAVRMTKGEAGGHATGTWGSVETGEVEVDGEDGDDKVRLLEVQLAATREILALQDRWLVAAGAVSVVHPPAASTDGQWKIDSAESFCAKEDDKDDECLEDNGGERATDACGAECVSKEMVGEKIVQEWRRQVYVLMLQEAAHSKQHKLEIVSLQETIAELETQIDGVRAELDMTRQAQVDLKAQVSMFKNQAEANKSKAHAFEEQQKQAMEENQHLQAERLAVIRMIKDASHTFVSLALAPAATPVTPSSRADAGKPKTAHVDGQCGLASLFAAADKLKIQQQRLSFASKRLGVAKALVKTRATAVAREHAEREKALEREAERERHRVAELMARLREEPTGGTDVEGGVGDVVGVRGREEQHQLTLNALTQRCAGGHSGRTDRNGGRVGCRGPNSDGKDFGTSDSQLEAEGSEAHLQERDSLLEEIERLMYERDALLDRLASADSEALQREAASAEAAKGEVKRLKHECEELRQKLSAALADVAADGQRVQELEADLARTNAQYKQASNEVTLAKAAAESERLRVVLAVETSVAKVKEAAEEEVRSVRAELLHVQRENGKQVVHLRQLERQLAAAQERTEKVDRLHLSMLEQRLDETQEALRQMRKERNSLLAALRHLQRTEAARKHDNADACVTEGQGGCAQGMLTPREDCDADLLQNRAQGVNVRSPNGGHVDGQVQPSPGERLEERAVDQNGDPEQQTPSAQIKALAPSAHVKVLGSVLSGEDSRVRIHAGADMTRGSWLRGDGDAAQGCGDDDAGTPVHSISIKDAAHTHAQAQTPAPTCGLNDTALSSSQTPCVRWPGAPGAQEERSAGGGDLEEERPSSAKALARRLQVLADGITPYISEPVDHLDSDTGDERGVECEDWRGGSCSRHLSSDAGGFLASGKSDCALAMQRLREEDTGAGWGWGGETKGAGRVDPCVGSKLDFLAATAQQLLLDD